MIGAIIGDIVGSRFEFVEDGNRGKDFALFASGCRFTDDSLMTLAVAKALLLSKGNYDNLGELTVRTMKDIAKPYPRIGWALCFINGCLKEVFRITVTEMGQVCE